ncbi:hypothetical protein CVS54_03706 [Microbacterium oxydans]|uniref:PIN domain-containing protein n=1 Tax=Microbacterium oxydans TaxID=82380 RepID=A0A3S5HTI1_9MICO|nr:MULTISPECIES: hypothetical protein [Microbacterium]AZS42343.1 hypothetical protein CVS54_03706 [Microbacterium oxydans]
MTSNMIYRIRRSGTLDWPIKVPTPEGPHFVYHQARHLFLGRSGRGPLHVAWDTNLLLDYFDHGAALWDNESLAERCPGEYGEELEALQVIISLWVVRDIRFHILEGTIADSRTPLSDERRARRRQAWREFCDALALVADDESLRIDTLLLPRSALQNALAMVPAGNDRRLVAEAVQSRLHVFLTRDKGVLAAKEALRPFGLLIMSPGDLLEALAAAGAIHCLLDRRHLYWPMPDQQRVSHLIRALDPTEFRA